MKLPDLYRDWRLVAGLALVALGVGNLIVGGVRTQLYSEIVAHESDITSADEAYRSFDELDSGAGAVLEPFNAEQRRVSYATARMDFYHATYLAGRVLVIIGVLLTLIGFIALIQNDARRARNRMSVGPGIHSPPRR
ncbi:MAG: hypothetical protein ACREQN_15930 [Candidatus Binataceae bacterium]